MISIVNQLSTWAEKNEKFLEKSGIQLIKRIPDVNSSISWKASIGLTHNGVLVSYTVWERDNFQTELIIMNTLKQKTIMMVDKTPTDPHDIHLELDDVVKHLLAGVYLKMEPDPKLIIR